LDVRLSARDNGAMKNADKLAGHKLQMLMLERRDASRNMARFYVLAIEPTYVLAIEPTLFGDATLVREWGRIGSTGRGGALSPRNAPEFRLALDTFRPNGSRYTNVSRGRFSGILAGERLFGGCALRPIRFRARQSWFLLAQARCLRFGKLDQPLRHRSPFGATRQDYSQGQISQKVSGNSRPLCPPSEAGVRLQ
jgi:hypothetical protein